MSRNLCSAHQGILYAETGEKVLGPTPEHPLLHLDQACVEYLVGNLADGLPVQEKDCLFRT